MRKNNNNIKKSTVLFLVNLRVKTIPDLITYLFHRYDEESYMVKVGKQDTIKKYYQLNNMKN